MAIRIVNLERVAGQPGDSPPLLRAALTIDVDGELEHLTCTQSELPSWGEDPPIKIIQWERGQTLRWYLVHDRISKSLGKAGMLMELLWACFRGERIECPITIEGDA
jgi:hypothetical protein